jgi:hypothetical protein
MTRAKAFKHCQSCGMPLAEDERGGGANSDGSKSAMYCSHCCQNGAFTEPDLTVEQMQEKVRQKLRDVGIPGFVTGLLTRKVPKLRRWNRKKAP